MASARAGSGGADRGGCRRGAGLKNLRARRGESYWRRKRLRRRLGFPFRESEGPGGVLECHNRDGSADGVLGPEEPGELGQAFVDPGMAGVDPGVGERVCEVGSERFSVDRADRSDEKGAILVGLGGMIEDGQRGKGLGAEPVCEERLDLGRGGGEGGECVVVIGNGGDEGGIAGRTGKGGCGGGEEEAGGSEAERTGFKEGGGDSRGLGGGHVWVVADSGELAALATEEGCVGWIADVLDCEAKPDGGRGLAEPGSSDSLKELCAVA